MDRTLYFCARFLGFFLLKLLFRLEVIGRENLKEIGSSCIIASNHQSYLDPIVLGYAFPRRLIYFAKKDIFSVPILSFLIRHLGAIPVDREELSSMTMRKGVRIIKEGNWFVIFPEGTRSRTRELLEPKEGIGFLHYKTGAPIVPVFISGSGRALPVGAKFIRPVKVRVFIGKKMEIEGKDYKGIAKKVMDAIRELKEG
ncbi:MAG: lysophospholipid acyltransferase family protein [Candidatus Ratteibacteria bacterium]|nr:lysophospholipid acyltransferase family protein [Candidatus Ratteibacteria bacterium]